METALELLFAGFPTLFGVLLCLISGRFRVLQRVAPAVATVVPAGGVFAYASILMGSSFGLAGLMAIGSSVLAVVIFNALYGVGFASQRPPDAKQGFDKLSPNEVKSESNNRPTLIPNLSRSP